MRLVTTQCQTSNAAAVTHCTNYRRTAGMTKSRRPMFLRKMTRNAHVDVDDVVVVDVDVDVDVVVDVYVQ